MRGQQGHLYLSVREREGKKKRQKESSLFRKCREDKTERRALSYMCQGARAEWQQRLLLFKLHWGEICQWGRNLLSHRAAWSLGPAPWDGVCGTMWDVPVGISWGSG